MQGNIYITELEIFGFEFTNRDGIEDPKYKKVVQLSGPSGKLEDHYAGYFYPGTYDTTPENLANNPNRVKILYKIVPYNATNQNLSFEYDTTSAEGAVYFDDQTNEFIFLKPRTVYVVLTTHDGSTIKVEVGITLV